MTLLFETYNIEGKIQLDIEYQHKITLQMQQGTLNKNEKQC